MKLFVFSVFDAAVGSHAQPFFARSQLEATRMFVDAVQDRGTNLNKHPGDFTLWRLGEFDDQLGRFFESKEPVITAAAVMALDANPTTTEA